MCMIRMVNYWLSIKKKFWGVMPEIKAFDENDNIIAVVKGDLMANQLKIADNNNRVLCEINKPWFKATVKHMDYYHIEFKLDPSEIELKEKIFGLLVVIDEEFHGSK